MYHHLWKFVRGSGLGNAGFQKGRQNLQLDYKRMFFNIECILQGDAIEDWDASKDDNLEEMQEEEDEVAALDETDVNNFNLAAKHFYKAHGVTPCALDDTDEFINKLIKPNSLSNRACDDNRVKTMLKHCNVSPKQNLQSKTRKRTERMCC